MQISVVVTTYNHEKYISQCLESILCQKGDFQVEVIVGDDCSTDNTRTIALRFQEKYPWIIKILPPEPNLGITKNLKRSLDVCSGDYIAICEGDDYWTDEYKLLKQSDFLENHKDYSMCFSPIIVLYEDQNKFESLNFPQLINKDTFSSEELIEENFIGNFSCCMYRTEVVKQLPPEIFDFFTVDWMFNVACGRLGKIGLLHDWMSVYRKHPQGAWSGRNEFERLKELRSLIDIYDQFYQYRYHEAYSKYAQVIDDRITVVQHVRDGENNDVSKLVEIDDPDYVHFVKTAQSAKAANHGAILDLMFWAREKSEAIRALTGQVEGLTAMVAERDWSVRALTEQSQGLSAMLAERDNSINLLNGKLREIKNSYFWRLLQFLRRLRSYFLPPKNTDPTNNK
jgi:glycosyltransferase involved in cell wall biosynthesis